MGISHIEITWINGTVRLDHNLISAVSVLLAGFGRYAKENSDVIFKLTDIGGAAL